ncbi:MAG TPA: hypothetical protein PKH10_03365 [bacterium]|nr:hypothetical protein [bacterium]
MLAGWSDAVSRIASLTERAPRSVLILFVFAATLIPRLYRAFTDMGPVACDEIFQTIEVAHKLAFGRGFLYWEWSEGVRSYVLPGLLAGSYRLLDLVGVRDPYMLAAGLKGVLALLHAGGWVFLFLFLAIFLTRFSALLVAVASGLLYAGIFASVRTLGETVSMPFLLAALYFAARALDEDRGVRAVFAGLLAGIAFAIRFQTLFFSAALGLVLLLVARRRRAVVPFFVAGFAGILILTGLVDLFVWGGFLRSVVKYFDFNVLQDGASRFGRETWTYYFTTFPKLYPWLLIVPALVVAVIGIFFRRTAMLVVPLAVYVLPHLMTPHKEVRFLFPVYALFGLLALLGWERLSILAAPRHRPVAAVLAVAIALSSGLFHTRRIEPSWAQAHPLNNAENMEPSFALGRIPDIKKGFVFDLQQDFSGGHAYFHANADIQYVRFIHEARPILFSELRRDLPGRYFAIRKRDEKHFAQYLPFLAKVAETTTWGIYRRDRMAMLEPEKISLARLTTPTREGAAWDAPGTVRVWENGLRVSLDAVRNDGSLELSADNNDRYELSFIRGGMTVGYVVAEPQRGKEGLVIHRLEVPAPAREQGYDEIVIMPSGGDGVFSVGHLLLER